MVAASHAGGIVTIGASEHRHSRRRGSPSMPASTSMNATGMQNWRGPGGFSAEPPYRISRPVSRVL